MDINDHVKTVIKKRSDQEIVVSTFWKIHFANLKIYAVLTYSYSNVEYISFI